MMGTKGLLLLLTVTLTLSTIADGQAPNRFKVSDCSAGPQACILLTECPELLKLLRPPTRESIRKLQSLTCGFQGTRNPKVCCPTVVSPPTDNGPPTGVAQPLGESLLPRACGHTAPLDKIWGGIAAALGGYPWMAVFAYEHVVRGTIKVLRWECGGSLINNRYVLTAAHCTGRSVPLIQVRLGENNLETDLDCAEQTCAAEPLDFGVAETIRHPTYRERGFYSDDIALIRLDRPVPFSPSIQPVCLPSLGDSYSSLTHDRDLVTVTGWGDTETGRRSQQLLEVSLPLMTKQNCKSTIYRERLLNDDSQECIGGGIGKDSCNKDSGGPAVITKQPHGPPYVQVGIVSYGPSNCGTEGAPGVYSSVAHFRSWIVQNLKP